jgi:6-phosphogluconolactonase (cycloisomerase 2 family)
MDLEGGRVSRSYEVHPATKWTLEIMAGAIYSLKEFSKPVNPRYLQINHKNLYLRIANFPGGWKTVVKFAGFDPDEESGVNLRSRGRAPVFDDDY